MTTHTLLRTHAAVLVAVLAGLFAWEFQNTVVWLILGVVVAAFCVNAALSYAEDRRSDASNR